MKVFAEHFMDNLDANTAADLFKATVNNVEIAISSYCNRICPYCPNAIVDRHSTRNFMDDAIFSNVVKQLGDIGYSGRIAIHRYNEPLADRDYTIKRIKEIKLYIPLSQVFVFTNGDFLTKEIIQELKEAGVSNILVSSHSMENDSEFESVLNRQQTSLDKLGLPYRYLQVSEAARVAAVDAGEGIAIQWNAINYYHRDVNGTPNMLDRGQSVKSETKYVRTDPCLIPFTELQIEWDGKVLPCCNIHIDVKAHEKFILGQITSDSNIFLVWTNSNFVTLRKELFSYKPKGSPCTTCNYGCTGDTPELRAEVAKYQQSFSGNGELNHGSGFNMELTTISLQDIALREPNAEEKNMLDHLKKIEGLMLDGEALALYRISKKLPEKSKILEIGSYQGGSTLALGHAIKETNIELYCLDSWANYLDLNDFSDFDRSKMEDDFGILCSFIRNTSFIGENLRMLRGKSSSFAGILKGGNFDFIFIDGAHDYESVRNDIKIAFSALKPGGIICGHDYHNQGVGVRRAVGELIAVPTISVKGVIAGTYIWFGVIPDPKYEYSLTDISDLMNAGHLTEALEKAYALYSEYKNSEILNYILAIKSELNT